MLIIRVEREVAQDLNQTQSDFLPLVLCQVVSRQRPVNSLMK